MKILKILQKKLRVFFSPKLKLVIVCKPNGEEYSGVILEISRDKYEYYLAIDEFFSAEKLIPEANQWVKDFKKNNKSESNCYSTQWKLCESWEQAQDSLFKFLENS